ncbi:MAG TPA: hypothetical protein VED67_05405 [Thermodesulfovibrionales bacterium]|nr:hypothetical protein [Thermodesulfovibrionales bacterium]
MKARKEMVRMGTKVGAVLGGIAFLAFGIVPGFYFGSYGILVLMNHLFGGPLQATVLVRIAVAAGVVVGITCIASVTIVVGAIFGTAVGYLTEALTSAAREKAPAEEAHVKAE